MPLDLSLACSALKLALSRKYDAVHSHEEGGVIGVLLAWWLGVPHLYDMHSSLPQQVANFGYGNATWLKRTLGWFERLMIRRSRVVIVICQDLETTVREVDADVPTVLIENAPGSGDIAVAGRGDAIRAGLGVGADVPIVLYTGTFENYQGLDLLYDAMAVVVRTRPDARLVMVGGEPAQVEAARRHVAGLGLDVVGRLHGAASGGRGAGVPRRRDHSRVAAVDRHEHAAEDLSVPAIGPPDRRDQSAHAHAGVV